jgi:LEA14-like dessication related protein
MKCSMKRTPLLGLVVVLSVVGSGCAILRDVSLGGLTLDTLWSLENPNAVGLSLASVDYALFIDGRQVVAGAPQNGLQVPAKGSAELRFPAVLRFEELGAVVETFLTKDLASWRVEGSLGVQTPIGVLRLPLAREGVFEVPKLPSIALSNPRITSLSLAGATIEFPLTVTNRNSYTLPIDGLTGGLSISGSEVGRFSLGGLGLLEGRGARPLSVPVQVNFFNAGMAVANAIRSGQAPVQLAVEVQSGTQRLPMRVGEVLRFLR